MLSCCLSVASSASTLSSPPENTGSRSELSVLGLATEPTSPGPLTKLKPGTPDEACAGEAMLKAIMKIAENTVKTIFFIKNILDFYLKDIFAHSRILSNILQETVNKMKCEVNVNVYFTVPFQCP